MLHADTPRWRRALAASFGAALVVSPLGLLSPAQAADSDWTYSRTLLSTGVAQGYQMGVDEVNRKVYFTDAQARTDRREKVTTYDAQGEPNGWFWQHSSTGGSAKIVEFDMAEKRWVRDHSYLNLTRLGANAKKEGEAHSWDGIADTVTSQSSLRTHFSPNGFAIDPHTVYEGETDPTIITTHVRQRSSHAAGGGGGIVVYRASQGAPTDADRIWEFEDGSAVNDGSRRIAVNTKTHKAFITNMGSRDDARRGFVTVIDLTTKTVDARIAIPKPADTRAADGGVIGVAVDEANDLVYAGTISGGDTTVDQSKIFAIDTSNLDTSDPKDKTLNAARVTELAALVPSNARPHYVAEDKRLYVASYNSGTITSIDADPASATYGQALERLVDGETNSVAVDAERNLLYSAGLGEKTLKVYDTETFEEILEVPTYGRANDIAVDPVTGEVWVGYFSFAGMPSDKTEVFEITAPSEADLEVTTSSQAYGKAATATIVATDADGKALTGTVTLTGSGVDATATLKRGQATVALPATLAAGAHELTATYSGTGSVTTGSATIRHQVAKAATKVTAKVTRKATAQKKGKVAVSATGAAVVPGKVTITLKKGKATKKVTGTLRANKAVVTLPKLAKGTWKGVVAYAGNANLKAAKSSLKVVVKK